MGTLAPKEPIECSWWAGSGNQVRRRPFWSKQSCLSILERTAAQFSERPALATGEGEYSYSELYDSVGAIRRVLIAPTTDPDPLIGVMTGDDIGTYASILAILASGAGYVPISRTYPASRISQILDQAGIRRVLTSGPQPALAEAVESSRIAVEILDVQRS